MAFCTQRKFPGQFYENNKLAEINKMKCYSSIVDHRAWSIDRNQQTNYLVDAVHEGYLDTALIHKSEIEKTSKRVGTIDGIASSGKNRDGSKILELSMELEVTKMNNRNLSNENDDLRNRIANFMACDCAKENMENHLEIIENIIEERNDLRELLDKFLGVSDQIIELKIQADHMKKVESEYILLQNKFRDHQLELEALTTEKTIFEDRIIELQATNQETNSIKETNSKLEKELHELSSVISVSNNFIQDQENEIESKLHTITELSNQIEGLKVALSEAELKLNKKLRLEMDVELMEKELSIMIENSAENPNNHQVIDRQVEDLATAIKLTLGCMNYEFENDEEVNLVDANRQLKTLLLESSNKILEFKDVINKQEQNLMKVSNDFACKNDELTECLATVEELKRQLSNTEKSHYNTNTNADSSNLQHPPMPSTVDVPPIEMLDKELFENEINLADSPQNSDDEDGPELEDLENIFEKECSNKEQTAADTNRLVKTESKEKHREAHSHKSQHFVSDSALSEMNKIENENVNLKLENEKLVAEIAKFKDSPNCAHLNVSEMTEELEKLTARNEQLSRELSAKKLEKDLVNDLKDMAPDLKDLVLKNEELQSENENLLLKIRCLEEANLSCDLKPTESPKSIQEIEEPPSTPDLENRTEPDWVPSNEDLVAEIHKLQHSENKSNQTIRQMEKDLKKLESINENLMVRLNDKEADLKQLSLQPKVEHILQENEELKILNDNLSVEISELRNSADLAILNATNLREQLDNLTAVNCFGTDTEVLQKLSLQCGVSTSPVNSSQVSILRIGKDLERLAALNESLLTFNDADVDKKQSLLEEATPDVNKLLKQNLELRNANERLSIKMREFQSTQNRNHFDAIEANNKLEMVTAANERLQAQIEELKEFSSNDRIYQTDLLALKSENGNLKSTNDNLMGQINILEEKLRNCQNRTPTYLQTSSPSIEEQKTKERTMTVQPVNDYKMEIDWMVADMKKLQTKNENLRATNEKLLSQISDLQSCENRSNLENVSKEESERMLYGKQSESHIFESNRDIEIEWMKSDVEKLRKKNEKLRSTNESLHAEIGVLKGVENRNQKNYQQMERDLLRLSATNERLASQLNEKRLDKRQSTKTQDVNAATSNPQELLNKIKELSNSNECLALEIAELKSMDIVKMRNDFKKLSSTNESLKMQISELKLMSSNDLKMESDWMAADMKKLLKKNKKLNISNQNLMNDISELRKEFKSLENRANVNALQKLKELENVTALNESLKKQIKSEKKNSKSNEIGLEAFAPDVKKMQKKNEELKAANEKLLSVIINLKNSEKLASVKATELEIELKKLQETNANLQDTIENYVEKDWSKPKTELERICQLILREGVRSLTDIDCQYINNFFGKPTPTAEFEAPKTSRQKNTRKHCRICHQAADNFENNCECKQYEENKRLHLLKEIEETKLAIKHIQSSNDIEFDLNDVKNRLLKAKQVDTPNRDRQYGIKMSLSQGNVNVKCLHVTKPAKCGTHIRK